MQVAIVDDTPRDAQRLETYLHRYAQESNTQVDPVLFHDGMEFLEHYRPVYDLVIMDIDMPGLSGVDVARRLRGAGDRVVLMFVTNMPQYALAGYEVEAIDYVLKPVSYQDFILKLRKARRYIHPNRDKQIPLQTADGVVSLPVSDILYVESSLHYVVYHTLERDYRVRGTMAQVELALPAAFASLSNVKFGWPGIPVTLFRETFKWNIFGYDVEHGGLGYFIAYMIASGKAPQKGAYS